MIAENNMETHGSWDTQAGKEHPDYTNVVPCDKEEWKGMLLDRVNSMYQRDKNHPAILIWSCGNESFGGSVIYEMSEFYRKEDPTRLVHYEGVFNDRLRSIFKKDIMKSQLLLTPFSGILPVFLAF